jgi:hypothetical protein
VDHVQLPNLNETLNHLSQDQTDFTLGELLPHSEKHGQIRPIAILHNHVDVRAGLDSLVKTHGLVTLDEVVQANFLLDTLHVLLGNLHNVNNLTSVNLVDLLLRFLLLLRLANFTVLTDTQHFLNVNKIVSYFSNEGCLLFFALRRAYSTI